MEDKHLQMSMLFDFYGDILTEKQREVFDLYYNEDLSLTEIAEHTSITRQGVRDSVQRAEHTLQGLENALGLIAKQQEKHRAQDALLSEITNLEVLMSCGKPVLLQTQLSKLRNMIEAL